MTYIPTSITREMMDHKRLTLKGIQFLTLNIIKIVYSLNLDDSRAFQTKTIY